MKFWQLLSIFRDEDSVLLSTFSQKKWKKYFDHYREIESIVSNRRRDMLDAQIDNELLTEVGSKSKKVVFLSDSKNKIYSYENGSAKIKIPISKGIEMFPHDAIEEVFEKSESDVSKISDSDFGSVSD
jgi:hypothetical protein